MPDLFGDALPTLVDQIAEVRREIGQRKRAYPRWIAGGTLKQHTADQRMSAMRAALHTLETLLEAQKQ